MSTAELSSTVPGPSVPAGVRAAQVLLAGPLGAFVMFGAFYFTVLARPDGYGVVDGVLAVIALALGAGNVYAAIRLAGGGEAARRLALTLVGAHLAFSLVKIVGYAESEAAVIAGADLLALAVLASAGVRRHAQATAAR